MKAGRWCRPQSNLTPHCNYLSRRSTLLSIRKKAKSGTLMSDPKPNHQVQEIE
ncbi:hypothetical protein SynROS8604_01828 [Synechococcus sp. ROS8604]|nr:hypothetical protein SynROS8604_01828 [Synechococcus sp. ROS8604]